MGTVQVRDWQGREIVSLPGNAVQAAKAISEAYEFTTGQPTEILYVLDDAT